MTDYLAQRRAHYLVENGPRTWDADASVARWIVALVLRSGGRSDAVERADAMIPRDPGREPGEGLTPAEQLALAAAMYVTWSGAPAWKPPRIAEAFGICSTNRAIEILAAVASDIEASPELRSGVTDVSVLVREAMLERLRG